MGIFDKAKDLAGDNADKIEEGIDKAAEVADEKTGGEHSEHIEKGADIAKDQAGKLLSDEQ